jgi:hypothetical protein
MSVKYFKTAARMRSAEREAFCSRPSEASMVTGENGLRGREV